MAEPIASRKVAGPETAEAADASFDAAMEEALLGWWRKTSGTDFHAEGEVAVASTAWPDRILAAKMRLGPVHRPATTDVQNPDGALSHAPYSPESTYAGFAGRSGWACHQRQASYHVCALASHSLLIYCGVRRERQRSKR